MFETAVCKIESKMSRYTIFLIAEDDESRPMFRRILKAQGYRVSLAIDEEDALDRTNNGNFKADLILMNFPGTPVETILEVGRNIRRHARLNVLIVLIAASFSDDLEGRDIKVRENEYITYLEGGEQLRDLLWRSLPDAESAAEDERRPDVLSRHSSD